jgi:hypothetical protein
MKQIELRRTVTGWTATHMIDGEPDQSIVQLFGTATLPTAFTARATCDEVLLNISRLNSDAAIWVA